MKEISVNDLAKLLDGELSDEEVLFEGDLSVWRGGLAGEAIETLYSAKGHFRICAGRGRAEGYSVSLLDERHIPNSTFSFDVLKGATIGASYEEKSGSSVTIPLMLGNPPFTLQLNTRKIVY